MATDREPEGPAAGDRPDDGGAVVLLMHKDPSGVIRYVDEATTRYLGLSAADMVGRRSLEFIHPYDHDVALTGWVRMLGEPGSRHTMLIRHSNSAHRWLRFEVTNLNLLADPEHGVVITEMRPSGEALPEDTSWVSSQFLRRLTETLPLGVLQIDPAGRIVFSNERLSAVVGRPTAASVEEEFDTAVPADRERLGAALAAVLAGTDSDLEIALAHPELGQRRCDVQLRVLTDEAGTGITGALLCVIDVTEQARYRAEIEHRATYDALTHCLNRASILAALADAAAMRTGVGVIFVDLDRFKPINDQYGHAAGDRILRAVADRLRGAARDGDPVGRMGGDEFLVVCPGLGSEQAAGRVAGRLSAAVRQPVEVGGAVLVPSCSTGVAWCRDAEPDIDSLVARADAAMYAAKRGRPTPYRARAR